ncbi:hypothetical protein [Massilia cavernae]|nr:hypothetical protein [Massilia cavernae]
MNAEAWVAANEVAQHLRRRTASAGAEIIDFSGDKVKFANASKCAGSVAP